MKNSHRLLNSRILAIQVLQEVIYRGQTLDNALNKLLPATQDASFIKALCFGVIRYYYYLSQLVNLLLSKPLKDKDQDVYLLILCGIYELLYMRTPPHAAVSETVNAVRTCGKTWAAGLVNAVLRNYQRQQQQLSAQLEQNLAAHYVHPLWFIEAVKKAWPAHWQSILEANNQHPPMCLRINRNHCSREAYLEQLHQLEIHAQAIPYTSYGVMLAQPMAVNDIPGFIQGHVSVQDGAAQFAAELLELDSGQRVLDACAAPGGKTGHILEIEPKLVQLIALDIEQNRLNKVEENLKRLNASATLITADASNLDPWWDGKPFDRILLDAPCSGTGVIRRHPDIKLLRRKDDITQYAQQQLQLLTTLWQTLKVGGLLVYATCSIMPEENNQVIEQFLATQPGAQEKRINCAWGQPTSVGRTILPNGQGMDGFYYARLQKIST